MLCNAVPQKLKHALQLIWHIDGYFRRFIFFCSLDFHLNRIWTACVCPSSSVMSLSSLCNDSIFINVREHCTFSVKRAHRNALNIMHPVTHAATIHHVSVLWKTLDSCKERCQGSARQPLHSACQYMTPSWLGGAQKHQPLPLVFLSPHPSPVSSKWRSFLSGKDHVPSRAAIP